MRIPWSIAIEPIPGTVRSSRALQILEGHARTIELLIGDAEQRGVTIAALDHDAVRQGGSHVRG